MIKRIDDLCVDEEELDSKWQKLLSLIFLLLAGSMSFFSYTQIGRFYDTPLKFTPSLLSAIIAIFLIAPLYLRCILKWNKSIYTIISLILILLVFASFVELATGGNYKNSIVNSLIAASIFLSWLGIRGVAGVSWILVLFAAGYSFIFNNLAFGFNGFIYIVFGFLGLLLHTGLNPGAFVKALKQEYSPTLYSHGNIIKNDISESVQILKSSI